MPQEGVWGVYGKVLTSRFALDRRTWSGTDDAGARDADRSPGTILGPWDPSMKTYYISN